VFGRGVGPGRRGVLRISPSGSEELLLPIDDDESIFAPQVLPDGHTVLYAVGSGTDGDRWDKARIVAQRAISGERRVLVEGGSYARYLPSGHIVYIRGDVLFAVPFDLPRLQVIGSPVPVVEGVFRADFGTAHFAVSNTGSLVYASRPQTQSRLVQIDRAGAV